MLPLTSQHAVRAMIALARHRGGRPMPARVIAAEGKIPADYLFKVLRTLTRAGVLSATRGPSGGYRLARPPAQIHLVEIVELFEPVRAQLGCIIGVHPVCSDQQPCGVHARWRVARAAYVQFLERTRLDEMGVELAAVERAPGARRRPGR